MATDDVTGMTYGMALRVLLAKSGISMAELARRSGISRQYLSMLANGKVTDPSLSKAHAIADGLDLSVQDFLDLMYKDSKC